MPALKSVQTLVRLTYSDGQTVTLQTPPRSAYQDVPATIGLIQLQINDLAVQLRQLGIEGVRKSGNQTLQRMRVRDRNQQKPEGA